MANTALGSLLNYLRRFHDRAAAEATDSELLRRHIRGDEAAFAALLHRHAPMVWGVCRRLLDNEQDAEDAFQASFLVLLRRAESLRVRQSLAAFLHGVASRIARKARVAAQRRRRHEARAESPRPSDPFAVVEQRQLRALLDEELDRLPEKYRAPLVLCYLEGMSYTEAARQLSWKEGTVCGRLARARELLRQRLRRRGLTLSGAALAAVLTESSTAPAATVAAVARMAALFALGQAAVGSVSPSVATLAQAALQAMTVAKLKTLAVLVVVLTLFVAGAGATATHFLAMKPPQDEIAANAPPDKPTAEKSERTDLYGDPLPRVRFCVWARCAFEMVTASARLFTLPMASSWQREDSEATSLCTMLRRAASSVNCKRSHTISLPWLSRRTVRLWPLPILKTSRSGKWPRAKSFTAWESRRINISTTIL